MNSPRLTSLSHGGGCGCKIAPSVLENILQEIPLISNSSLLVGPENRDDAAVYLINENQAIIATTDFFMPIVDDPEQFGRIASVNAVSDVYAMGGTPILALSVMGMPVKKLSEKTIKEILHGATEICRSAGIPLAGGHSIDSEEPIFGLVVIGIVHPDHIKRNQGALPGDDLILGKSLGIGILSHVLKNSSISSSAYEKMIRLTNQLNIPGMHFGKIQEVHAMTDVTGFGLSGHLLEICQASGVSAEFSFSDLPFISESVEYAKAGNFTGASARNWKSYGDKIQLFEGWEDWQKHLLSDPQTAGGLLLSVDPSASEKIISIFHDHGFTDASIIGNIRTEAANDPKKIKVNS